jgi:hypothetical protein
MKGMVLISRYFSFVTAFLLLFLLIDCKQEALPTPPAPVLSEQEKTSGETVIEEPPTTSTALTDSRTTPTPTPALAVSYDKATVTFPDRIVFSFQATSPTEVSSITLKYGSSERTLAPEISTSQPDFTASKDISVSWTWEMKKTGSIPPGANIWWQWQLTNANGETMLTQRQMMPYLDTRYNWQSRSLEDINIYWHDQNESLIDELIKAIDEHLSNVPINVEIPAERTPKVFIYRSSQEIRDAVLFENEWTGALAYTRYNIILTALNTDILDWAKDALPHEIMHLFTAEAVFGPFGNIPIWLNEGLSKFVEGELDSYYQRTLNDAVAGNKLISIQSLNSNFPADTNGAYLAYAESHSIVAFLINNYGWDKMRSLLATFKDGSTPDNALTKVWF